MIRRRSKIPEETLKKIVEMKQRGCRNTQIVEETGIDRHTVIKYTRDIKSENGIGPYNSWDIEDVYYLIDFYPINTVQDVADCLGKTFNQVEYLKNRLIKEGHLKAKGRGWHRSGGGIK